MNTFKLVSISLIWLICVWCLTGDSTGYSSETTDADTDSSNTPPHLSPLTADQPIDSTPLDLSAGISAVTYPLTLTDAAGRAITFDKQPQRIVVIGRGPFMTLHTLFMFPEVASRIVGYENRSYEVKDFISLVQPMAAQVMELGTNPGLEQIASLNPDLVLKKGNAPDSIGDMVERAGIPVFYIGLETPEQFFADVRNLGRILGNPERAETIIGYYRARLDMFETRTAALTEKDKPGILVLHYDGRGSHTAMRVPPKNWMQTIQVEKGGGRPVWLSAALAPGGWAIVNFEQIAAWNPDKIYIVFPMTADPIKVMSELNNHPLWKRLKAAETGNLRAFPSDMIGWDTPEPRWLLGMTWMAVTTHPRLFEDIDLNREIDAFFSTLYGIDPAVIDTRIRPAITILDRTKTPKDPGV